MLKILHLLTAAAALLICAASPFLNPDQPYFNDANSIALGLFGMLNLLIAPFTPHGGTRQQLKITVSVLLVLAAALQALVLLAPLPSIGGQPAILYSLILALVAALLHLVAQQPTSAIRHSTSHVTHTPISAPAEGRELGTVKWFNTSKGFGFISRDSGDDIFVHFRAIRGEGHRVLIEGQRVEFSVMNRDKGLQAEDVVSL